MKTRMPPIARIASELVWLKSQICDEFQDEEGNIGMDVRLQVYEGGSWCVHTGDSSYDQDHRGYWGSGFLTRSDNCRELARDLIDQCAEHASQNA